MIINKRWGTRLNMSLALYFWSNRPAYFTIQDFFRLFLTSVDEYNCFWTPYDFLQLSWHCITVALFLKIKKPVIGCTTNLQDFIKLVEVGLALYSYGFQPLLSTFTMPIFCVVDGLSLLWTFLDFHSVALWLHLNIRIYNFFTSLNW